MKKKKINKLSELIVTSLSDIYPKKESHEEELILDCSEETFIKFEKLVNHLIKYDVNISINTYSLNIYSSSYKKIKNDTKINGSAKNTVSNESELMEIFISKYDHFYMNIGYQKKCKFKRKGVYDHFYERFLKTLENNNNNNFIDVYNEIMKESGLLRDENLDNLLNEV